MLFPLFKADLMEISQWFPFDEDYQLEYDLAYVDEKTPPFDETFVIYYNGKPYGRVGLYDYDQSKGEIYLSQLDSVCLLSQPASSGILAI